MPTHKYGFNPNYEFAELYKVNKKIGRLIRSNTFDCETNYSNLKCKITYIKYVNGELKVNVKVSGNLKPRWSAIPLVNIINANKYMSNICRNDEIRHVINKDISNYFKYFGIMTNVSISKIKICHEL